MTEENRAMLNKRGRIALLLGIAILLGLAGWFTFRPREPKFEGKRLSEWIAETALYPADAESHEQASTAIKTIGTAAIPFLLQDLQTETYPWEHLPEWIEDRMPDSLSLPVASTRQDRAIMGFHILGAIAAPAIPELDRLATENDNSAWHDPIFALSMIGTEEVVPVLLKHLGSTNNSRRSAVVVALADLGVRAAAAFPAVRTNLNSPDRTIRRVAVRALSRLAPTPDANLVNELAGLLNDPDKSVQRAALSSLAKWAPQAASAGPELRQMIQRTPDSAIRRQAEAVLIRVECEFREGGIVRGPKGTKAIAMVFTGHEYAEGAETVLDQLAKHRAKASCFLTGDFLRNTNFAQLVVRAAKEGHLIGPHSDKHPLYCSWEAERRTLVSEKEFNRDLADNESEINRLLPSDPASPPVAQELAMFARRYGLTRRVGAASVERAPYLLPPFEHYNRQIVEWTTARGMKLIKFTPGTRSNADYTGEADTNFVSSQAIFDSILKCEREDPHGLNGFILLFHLGSGTRRADKFHTRFGELLDVLAAKGYQFVRVDELLEPSKESQQTEARQGEK